MHPALPEHVYQLKVTLREIEPPIWRRVLVDGASTLAQVHEVIQAAMGWWDYHLHEFRVGDARYGIPDPDYDPEWDRGGPTHDDRHVRLHHLVGGQEGLSFTYSYDFGDGWEHDIVVERVFTPDARLTLPACTDGARACPPEDCGGPWGYAELLTILADPRHPEHHERAEWAKGFSGRTYRPEDFAPTDFAEHHATLAAARRGH